MKPGNRNLKLGVGLLLVLGLFLAWRISHRQPTYEGRTTEQWLQVLHEPIVLPSNEGGIPGISGTNLTRVLAQRSSQEADARRTQAEAALRSLGTNALPTLLEKLQARDSAMSQKLAALVSRLGIDPYEYVLHEARDHKQALQGFAVLGPIAKPAIPDLVKLLDQPQVAGSVYEALAQLDDNPVPWLLRTGTNSNTSPSVRANAMYALGNRQTVDGSILAVLLAGVKDTNANVRYTAASKLWRFPEHADRTIPVLIDLLDDSSESVREGATSSLAGLGQMASSAVPALLKAIEKAGEDVDVKFDAAFAMKRIAPNNPSSIWVEVTPGLPVSFPMNFDTNGMMPRARPIVFPRMMMVVPPANSH